MKNFLTFVVVLALAVLTSSLFGLALLPNHPVFFWMIMGAIWTSWGITLYQSFYVIPKKGLRRAMYFLGTFEGCYLSLTDWEETQKRYRDSGLPPRGRLDDFERHARRGPLDELGLGDIFWAQWPFFSVENVTTGLMRIEVKASEDIWTAAEGKDAPPIQLAVDVDLNIRLGVDVGALRLAFPDADLANSKTAGEALATNLAQVVQDAARESIGGIHRGTGNPANHPGFSWGGPTRDIVANRGQLEQQIRFLLREQRESAFVQAGLLAPWNPAIPNGGPGAAVLDISVERIGPKNPDLSKAVDGVAMAGYEAEALNKIKDKVGISADLVVVRDIMKDTDATIIVAGSDVLSAIGGLTRIPKPKPRRGP